jgi:hypothetical protein
MTRLLEFMTRIPVTRTTALIGAAEASLVVGLIGIWLIWRVRKLLAIVPQVEERLNVLSNSIGLLTDTTEACFSAVSMQLQFMQSNGSPKGLGRSPQVADLPTEPTARRARQRRVVGASARGETVAAIAAREELAEGEVGLRLNLERGQAQKVEPKRYGTLFS